MEADQGHLQKGQPVAEIAGSGEGSGGAHSFAAGLGKELIRAAGSVAASALSLHSSCARLALKLLSLKLKHAPK
mgnify:CR=1 FL=1